MVMKYQNTLTLKQTVGLDLRGLQEKIDQILRSFDDLRLNKDSSHSDDSYSDPTRRRKQLAEEIRRVRI